MLIDPDRVQSLFLAALEVPKEGRKVFLEGKCGNDSDLKLRVLELISSHEQTGSFMDHQPDWKLQTADSIEKDLVGQRIGPYKLREQIGQGGMGIVFVAEQEQPIQRKVALKVIKPGMDSQQVLARFEAEQQALALMNHRNVAKVLDAGLTEAGRPYFVMDLVHGIPITEYCDKKQMSVQERLKLFVEVCRAIQHAHQKGIIHRDIKPSNVLVTEEDGEPIPKIIDFGVAKAVSQKLTDRTVYTNFRALVGTPLYASPEQAALSNTDVDTRSDVYSLGVLLYELITGETPFDRDQLQTAGYEEMCRIIREQEPPKPSTKLSTLANSATGISKCRNTDPRKLQQTVRGDLDWIVMKALEKDRGRRYAAASSLAEDILKSLNNDVISARPPSVVYQLGKVVRRNRLAFGFIATGLFTLFCGLAIGFVGERSAKIKLIETQLHLKQLVVDYERDLVDQAFLFLANGEAGKARQVAEKIQTVTETLQQSPTSVANTNFIDGAALFFSGHEQEGYEKLKIALRESPDNIGIKAMAALCQRFSVGDVEYERLLDEIRNTGKTTQPYDNLFYAFAELYRDPMHASVIADRAVDAAPSTLGAAIQSIICGHLAIQRGGGNYLEQQLKLSGEAIQDAPSNAFVLVARQFACLNGMVEYGETHPEYASFVSESSKLMKRLQTVRPKYNLGSVLAADHHIKTRDWQSAADAYVAMAKQGIWLESFAPIFLQTQKTDEMLRLFDDYASPPMLSRLTTAYLLHASNVDRAVQLCHDEFEAYPTNKVAIDCAEFLLYLERPEEAKSFAEKALEKTPKTTSQYWLERERLQFIVDEDFERFERSTSYSQLHVTRQKYLDYERAMLAIANRQRGVAEKHLRSVLKLEWPSTAEALWAAFMLQKWETDPDWTPGNRN